MHATTESGRKSTNIDRHRCERGHGVPETHKTIQMQLKNQKSQKQTIKLTWFRLYKIKIRHRAPEARSGVFQGPRSSAALGPWF